MVRTLSRILTPIHTSEHALPANLFRKNSLRRGREAARRGTLRGASTAETETQGCVCPWVLPFLLTNVTSAHRCYSIHQSPQTEIPRKAPRHRKWALRYSSCCASPVLIAFMQSQPTALQSLLPGDLQSRCLTSIYLRTKSCSCRICPRASARTNSWHSFLSEYRITAFCISFVRTDIVIDIPTCTKFVSLQTRKTSRSSSIWMKEVPPSQRMHYTTTSLMAKTRSRYDSRPAIRNLLMFLLI